MQDTSDRKIADMILQFSDLAGGRVLEIGCGDGRITDQLAGLPQELFAIDPDKDKIAEAQGRNGTIDFRVGSGEHLNFSDAQIDVVLFTLSLHHQDSRTALKEAARVLKDDGRILVIEPRMEGEIEQVFALVHNEDLAKQEAQKAINESDLILDKTEVFDADWVFEDRADLSRSVLEYYGMTADDRFESRLDDLLGQKLETRPIILQDRMVIQSLRKPPSASISGNGYSI